MASALHSGDRRWHLNTTETTTTMPASTNRLRVRVNGEMPWAFDEFRVMSRGVNASQSMILNAGTPETRTYDAWGRLATRAQGGNSASYSYRYGSRLYQATSSFSGESNVTYDYGGDGKRRWRVTASETRRYRYDRGWNPIVEESTASGTLTKLYEPGQAVGQRLAHVYGTLASGTYLYGYHDHLGSVRRWRLQNRNNARAVEFDPYGAPYAAAGSWSAANIFALHEFDTTIRQYRAPWRDYSPAMVRWTTRDPLGMVDGPNVFAYVKGNPVMYYDPLGDIAIAIPVGYAGIHLSKYLALLAMAGITITVQQLIDWKTPPGHQFCKDEYRPPIDSDFKMGEHYDCFKGCKSKSGIRKKACYAYCTMVLLIDIARNMP